MQILILLSIALYLVCLINAKEVDDFSQCKLSCFINDGDDPKLDDCVKECCKKYEVKNCPVKETKIRVSSLESTPENIIKECESNCKLNHPKDPHCMSRCCKEKNYQCEDVIIRIVRSKSEIPESETKIFIATGPANLNKIAINQK